MSNVRSAGDVVAATALDFKQAGPTAARMLVGAQLRRLRVASGLTREEAGAAIRGSDSKISRLELGRTGFKKRDVADLLTLYGVTDSAEREAVLEVAKQASTPGWWQAYDDVVPPWFEPYLGLEQAASVIRNYEVQFIPDLLQTAGYARAIIPFRHPTGPEHQVERRVALLAGRQRILWRPAPPKLWTVIDETALRRLIGGPAIMRAQLRHLVDMSELPHVTIQILPFSAGGHAAACGSVTFLRFPEGELPDVAYLEQLITALYLDKPAHTERYLNVLNRLVVQADQAGETKQILGRMLADL